MTAQNVIPRHLMLSFGNVKKFLVQREGFEEHNEKFIIQEIMLINGVRTFSLSLPLFSSCLRRAKTLSCFQRQKLRWKLLRWKFYDKSFQIGDVKESSTGKFYKHRSESGTKLKICSLSRISAQKGRRNAMNFPRSVWQFTPQLVEKRFGFSLQPQKTSCLFNASWIITTSHQGR